MDTLATHPLHTSQHYTITMKIPLSRAVFLLSAAVLVHADLAVQSNSYWVQYNGDAPAECVVAAGGLVDDACCTNHSMPFSIRPTWSSTCFVIAGLLGADGGSLMSYLGCDEDSDHEMVPYYGESCYNNGINGGLIPANATLPADANATSIADCGCTWSVSGNGCHKIRDFSALPGFASDPRQVFLYMDETCPEHKHEDDPEDKESGAAAMSACMVSAASALLAALWLV